jgi:hypothetical protein
MLPQRKKSAEEIAKLRESLGIGGPPPAAVDAPVESPVIEEPVIAPVVEEPVPVLVEIPGSEPEMEASLPVPIGSLPVGETHEAKPVRSLKRSERIPVLPIEESGPPTVPHEPEIVVPPPAPSLPTPQHQPKVVRSLRKSEQGPLPVPHTPPPDSKLPIHRHSDKELSLIRRHEMLAQIGAGPPPVLSAHLALVIPGYLSAIGGAAFYYFFDTEKQVPWLAAACVMVALAIAIFIFFKKPLSRHHAAFIAVVVLLVIVFGALYYFPQLRHGT